MAMSTVSKTVNPGSNPGSPAAWSQYRASLARVPWRRAPVTSARMAGTGKAGMELRVALAVAAGAIAMLIAFALGPAAAPASAACPHAGAHPREIPLPKLRKAVTAS